MIQAICFDLDGVYFTPESKRAAYDNFSEVCGNPEAVRKIFGPDPYTGQFFRGHISQHEFREHVRKTLNISLTDQECIDLRVKEYSIDTQVQNYIQHLKAQGYLICACTNNNASRIEGLQQKFGFLSDFDVFISSHEVGHCKPATEIFHYLIEKAGVLPEQLLYSDDNPERLDGAKAMGIQTYVYTDFESFKRYLSSLGIS